MTDDATERDDPRPHRVRAADPLTETRIGGEQVYRGALLDVRRDRARMPDKSEAVREYIVHPGAVLVVPRLPDGALVVERQFRYPHDRSFLEFPAGKLDPGEDALTTGVRELIEEVGYTAKLWIHLGVVHPVISYSTETIEIYAAHDLTHVGAKLDEGEFLEVHRLSLAELDAALDEGRVTDAKTVSALLLYERWTHAATRNIRARITGRVQGVGYRDFACREAAAYGLTGWVRNRGDGSVEAHVQGPRERCDAFVERCLRGPAAALVDRVVVTRAEFDAALSEFLFRPSEK